MKKFRSLSYLASICLILLLIASTLVMSCTKEGTQTSTSSQATSATTSKTTSTSTSTQATSTTSKLTTATSTTSGVPRSVLGCPQGPPTAGLTPQYGGTLKLIMANSPTNLGTFWKASSATDGQYARFAVEALIGLDNMGNPLPQLATSWEANPDKKTLTFTLRQGVKFHDGTDFNAAAAKWCLDMFRSGTKTDLKLVTSVDVIDDYHLRLTYSTWDPLCLNALAGNVAGKIVSPTAAQKAGDAALLNPVGTGPFKFVSYQPSVSCKFTRFDGYWQKGLPYLDAIEISIVADSVVALTSFTKGEAHAFMGVSTHDAKTLKDKGYTTSSYCANVFGIAGDSKNSSSPFSNINVRRAIAFALDSENITNSVYDNMFPSTNQLALPTRTAYDPTIKGYPYNPAKAQELLATAGYGTSNPLTTKLTYQTNLQRTDFFTTTQGYFKKVGINITLDPLDAGAFNKLYSSGWNNQLIDYNMSYNGIGLKYSTGLTMCLSANQVRFVSVWTPDDFNTLFNVMLVENDPDKREAYYRALNKMAVDDYCLVVPMGSMQSITAYSPNAKDVGFGVREAVEYLPERFWLSK